MKLRPHIGLFEAVSSGVPKELQIATETAGLIATRDIPKSQPEIVKQRWPQIINLMNAELARREGLELESKPNLTYWRAGRTAIVPTISMVPLPGETPETYATLHVLAGAPGAVAEVMAHRGVPEAITRELVAS